MPSPSQATGSDGVGSEVDDQSDSLDGDVALPECAPADASVLNVREAKQDGKEGAKDEKDEDKEEGEQLAASLAGALVASDAEQSKGRNQTGLARMARMPLRPWVRHRLNQNPMSAHLVSTVTQMCKLLTAPRSNTRLFWKW